MYRCDYTDQERYPVRRTTENRSRSVSLQRYSCLTLSSEHLVGLCRDSYCAYSDTEVRVKRKAPNARDYWYWFNYLFVGCSQLVSVHIIMFMLSPCVLFSLTSDYNRSNTLFCKIHQDIERTHTCSVQKTFVKGARLKQPLYVCIGQWFGWEI